MGAHFHVFVGVSTLGGSNTSLQTPTLFGVHSRNSGQGRHPRPRLTLCGRRAAPTPWNWHISEMWVQASMSAVHVRTDFCVPCGSRDHPAISDVLSALSKTIRPGFVRTHLRQQPSEVRMVPGRLGPIGFGTLRALGPGR